MTVIATKQIFISHSSENSDIAKKICAFLEKKGKKCWIAPRDISAGREYGAEIIDGIENSSAFVLIFSEVANRSQHVMREVERAINKKIPVIVYKIEDCTPTKSMEYFLLSNQWLDAVSDSSARLDELNADLDRLTQTEDTEDVKKTETVHVHNKAIPIMLGVIAAVIIVAAVLIAIGLSSASSQQTSTTASAETSEAAPEAAPNIAVGEYVSLGRYYPVGYTEENNDGEILWQVIGVQDGSVKLISAEIIDIKPYDCAESGKYDKDSSGNSYDRNLIDTYTDKQLCEFRGCGEWSSSDLRAWLNSEGAVTYSSVSQADNATDECDNSFGTQLGFLSSFTKDELSLLVSTDDDRVTLLSKDEVTECAKNESFILHPTVTKSAIASDGTVWYKTYAANDADDYIWVTKTQSETDVFRVYYVNSSVSSELFGVQNAAISGFGIRPVITVSLDKATKFSGEGSRISPYGISVS